MLDELCKTKDKEGLSFRKLALFNKALLAKQVWRLINSPFSLIARFFKARYYKDINVVDAEVGHNPSYIWRSLCWSWELLESGLQWKVATGSFIRLFLNAWIPELARG